MKYYKFLDGTKSSIRDFDYSGYLPKGKRPGKWLPKIKGSLELCENGYHVCRPNDCIEWLAADCYEVEIRGDFISGDDKVVSIQMRLLRKIKTWNEKSARLFAGDCAERVMHIFEKEYLSDQRPQIAIETSRKFANGEATIKELDAARAAAGDAAWNPARAAAWNAAKNAAGDAAWNAAKNAAGDAAGDAAWNAARA